jgi:hypothetical protein
MSTVDNIFTETVLNAVRMREDDIMFNDRIKQQFVPRVGDMPQAIQRLQTANITPLKTNAKEYTVEVMWQNFCDLAVDQSCTSCDAGGEHGSTNTQSYAINQCTQLGFTIDHNSFKDNEFGWEEHTAKAMLTAEARIVEDVVQDYITTIYGHLGTNAFGLDAFAVNVPFETQVAAANYTMTNMAPHFTKVSQFNQFTNPVIISGNLMYSDYLNTKYTSKIMNNDGDNFRFGDMDWYWDIYNMNLLGLTAYQFLVSTGATAFASRPQYSTTGIEHWDGQGYRWSRPSRFMPGLWINWTRKVSCSEDYLVEDYKAKAQWEHMVNPAGCTATNTGILLYHEV